MLKRLPTSSRVYSELCQTSKMGHFAKIVTGWNPLTIFAKRFMLDVWQGCKYTHENFGDLYFSIFEDDMVDM